MSIYLWGDNVDSVLFINDGGSGMLVICSDHHLLVNTLKTFRMAQVFLLTPSARNLHGS